MTAPTYTRDTVFAALCIMEEMIDPVTDTMPKPWADYRDQSGACEMRDLVIELAPHCDAAWQKAYTRYEAGKTDDPGSLDYEFVPVWLRHCVDWTAARPCAKHPHVLAEHRAAQEVGRELAPAA